MLQTTFIDLGVYTNHQNFRLILSSKFAERGQRPLNFYVPETASIIPIANLTYDMFRLTLSACNGLTNRNLLGWPSIQSPHNKRRCIRNQNAAVAEGAQDQYQPRVVPHNAIIHHRQQNNKVVTIQYPKLLDYFTTQVLPQWPQLLNPNLPAASCRGKVTIVEYSRYSQNFAYVKITGNRYCHAVQREHRHNNIYFIVHIPEFLFRQGCYDISCNGVLSQAFPIPPEIFF